MSKPALFRRPNAGSSNEISAHFQSVGLVVPVPGNGLVIHSREPGVAWEGGTDWANHAGGRGGGGHRRRGRE